MKKSLGFVIACCLAAGAGLAAATPNATFRPVARSANDAVPAVLIRPLRRPGTGEGAAVAPTPDRNVELSEQGDIIRPLADVRPPARNGLFVQRLVPADGQARVSREVTRIHFGSDNRPLERPPHPLADVQVVLASAVIHATPGSPQPRIRPAGFFERFKRKHPSAGKYSAKGAVCGVNAIKGAQMANFGKPGKGCGVANPVRVIEVAGVRLSQPATIDCTTAKSLNAWIEGGIKPAFGRQGGGVAELKIAAHYACRNRNNRAGGRLSEHAKGRAVDVSAIVLKDGTQVTVLKGWRSGTWGDEMKQVHRSACGPFGTVLGPHADRYHQDHFHVDTARYRSGSYCR